VSIAVLGEHLRGILEREKVTLPGGALSAIVREAQGSVRDALSLCDQVLSYAGGEPDDTQVIAALGIVDRDMVFTLCDAILAKDANAILGMVAEVDARGHDLSDLAGLLVEHFRDLMVAKVVDNPSEALLDRSPGELESLRVQGEKLSRPDLHRYFALLVSVADDVARSVQPRISLEMGLLRLLEVEPAHSLASLLEKLDRVVTDTQTPNTSAHGPSTPSSSQDPARVPDAILAPAPSQPKAGWQHLVERVRQTRPALASVLEHGRALQFGPQGVEIGYVPGTFYWESAQERDNRTLLARLLAEHFGQEVRLTLRALAEDVSGEVSTLAEAQESRRREREQEIKTDALKHPAVEGALSILGGEVREVIALGVDEVSKAN
jgi:DNA polymerase-3 subunit gamma/tau